MSLGEAPDADDVEELLRERHGVPVDQRLKVEVSRREGRPRLILRLDRPARATRPIERYVLDVSHLRQGQRPAWDLVLDATDALLGTLLESGYAYRDLPTGSDVEFEDAVFWVEAECLRPDLEREADQLLGGDN